LHVGGLEAFGSLGEVELDGFALIQAAISVLLDRRKMYEYILTRGALDESVTFGSVKPLDCPFFSHNPTPFAWFSWNDPCFAERFQLNPEERSLETSWRGRENKGCSSARSFSRKAKGPQIRSDEIMRRRQSRSLEPVQSVDSTADRNINPNPRFGRPESPPSRN
jgi:hypothetical protein